MTRSIATWHCSTTWASFTSVAHWMKARSDSCSGLSSIEAYKYPELKRYVADTQRAERRAFVNFQAIGRVLAAAPEFLCQCPKASRTG
jgi:hypothetical protein